MIPLPWWIIGTVPSDDESDVEINDPPEDATLKDESMTPLCMFRTPSASPCVGVADHLPVDYSMFIRGAKRRSSAVLESETPETKTKISRKSGGCDEKKKFERKETEIMDKTIYGLPANNANETFNILESDSIRPGSPSLHNRSNPDDSVSLKDVEYEQEDLALIGSPSRDYPMFFTSFNDTTVLFNTTITGDLDSELDQKNAEVGDWVFKGNQFLQEMKKEKPSENLGFKEPVKKPRKTREKKRDASVSARSEVSKSSRRRRESKQETTETSPIVNIVPAMERRRTPSRKAKTYKSMQEI